MPIITSWAVITTDLVPVATSEALITTDSVPVGTYEVIVTAISVIITTGSVLNGLRIVLSPGWRAIMPSISYISGKILT